MRVRKAAIHAISYGLVQRVHFRIFVLQNARAMGLTGYVKNLSNEKAVEVVAEGERKKLKKLVRQLKKGPGTSRVQRVVVNWYKYSGEYNHFGIKS
jgi:acylphosphatase